MATRLKILFLIRDRMGDSLIAANVALAFARAYPECEVTVMIRSAYAYPLLGEPSLKIVRYRSGLQAFALSWWWRVSGKRFDVLGVFRGFGRRTRSLMRRIPAQQIIVEDPRLRAAATHLVPQLPKDYALHEQSLQVARAIRPDLPEPQRIHFPRLAQAWKNSSKKYVVIFPISDQSRKSLLPESLETLYASLSARYQDRKVLVLVRNRSELAKFARRPAVPITMFRNVPNLCRLFMETQEYFGIDTGPMHLAAGMGIPCTVFFGPTQPHRVLPAGQPNVHTLRASVLGRAHCDVIECTSPICISQVVVQFVGREEFKSPPLLPNCPLRSERARGDTPNDA